MKYTMMIGGLISFAFGLWVATSIRSDIQIIIVEVAILGGFILFGLAAVLNEKSGG